MEFSHKIFYTLITAFLLAVIVIFTFSVKEGKSSIFSKNESSAFLSLHLREDGLFGVGSTTVLSLVQTDHDHFVIKVAKNVDSLNAAEIEVFFDPDHFLVEDLVIDESLCEKRFLIKRVIDNDEGRLFYQCGTVNPQSFSDITLSKIKVIPKNNGTSTIRFGSNSNLYVHDGLGTKVDLSYGEYVVNNMFY